MCDDDSVDETKTFTSGDNDDDDGHGHPSARIYESHTMNDSI